MPFDRIRCFALAMLFCTASQAQNILNNGDHAAAVLQPSLIILLGAVPGPLADKTDITDNSHSDIVALATDTGRTNYNAASNAIRNSAPYAVTSTSYANWTLAIDRDNYAAMISGGIVDNWAFVTTLPAGTAPPVAAANITHQAGSSGPGIEFGMSSNYKGLNTSNPSSTTAAFAAILAAVKSLHPSWTWPDVKGALRQTANNWATGYDDAAFGYGFVNYDAAIAIPTASALYLQPPNMVVTAAGKTAVALTLYPYRQTRRAREIVYFIPADRSLPLANELTIADLISAGAVLAYMSNGTDVIPQATVNVLPGAWNLIAFTTDDLGNYSRVELFQPVRLTLATMCG